MTQTDHQHTPSAIAARLRAGHKVNYLQDWVLGGIDGAVTTFAIIAGSLGASLSTKIIIILGFANLLADGLSMAASNYLSTKADLDDAKRLKKVEEDHIAHHPQGEREEVRQIFAAKGFSGPLLEEAVNVITADRELWISTMLAEEYGVGAVRRSPVRAGLATFAGFLVCGLVPLIPFLLGIPQADWVALGITALTFLAIGIAKSQWSLSPWWASGLETLAIGLAAAVVAFGIGYILNGVFA